MNIVLITLGIIVGIIILMVLIGYVTPVKHTASVTEELKLPDHKLYKLLINFKNYPKWRTELKGVKVISESEWVEVSKFGEMALSFTELVENKKIVGSIVPDKSLQFGGSWTYDLQATGSKTTKLTVTENGEVYSPLFRFVSKYIMGHKGTLKRFMKNLQDEIGD